MRLPGFSFVWKTSSLLLEIGRSIDLKHIKLWLMTVYVNWWPVISRLFT